MYCNEVSSNLEEVITSSGEVKYNLFDSKRTALAAGKLKSITDEAANPLYQSILKCLGQLLNADYVVKEIDNFSFDMKGVQVEIYNIHKYKLYLLYCNALLVLYVIPPHSNRYRGDISCFKGERRQYLYSKHISKEFISIEKVTLHSMQLMNRIKM